MRERCEVVRLQKRVEAGDGMGSVRKRRRELIEE